MSGTDFTRTTNYQFYKPIYQKDIETWGDHANANFDSIDTLIKSLNDSKAGFLPLTGGTLTGPLMQPNTSNPFVLRDAAGVAALPSWPNATLMGLSRDQGNVRLSMTLGSGTPFFEGRTATGGLAAPAANLAGQALLTLTGGGYDGATWTTNRVTISLIAAAQWSPGNAPTAIQFNTMPPNSTTIAERARINDRGALLLGTTIDNGADVLQVLGGTLLDGLTMRAGKDIMLARDPSAALHAATRQYVDGRTPLGFYLQLSGGTLTGPLTLAGEPVSALGAATKQTVDLKAPLASPAFTGNPTAPTQAPGDADTSLATTAFVAAATAAALNSPGRNLLHNPLFNIAQRGAGGIGASTTGWTYSADRWALIIGAAGDTFSHTPIAIADAQRAQIGDESATTELACNFTGGSGAANTCLSAQFIEGVRRLAGKTVTVSFYALAAAGSPKLGVSLDQFFGSTGSPSATVEGAGQSVTISSATWARYALTFAVPSISGKTLGTAGNDQTSLLFWHSAGANSAIRSGNVGVQSGTHLIWGVQLEVGTVATPLEKPDPQQDWAKCQRFFYAGGWNMGGYQAVGGTLEATFPLPSYMRAAPTIQTTTAQTNGNATAVSTLPLTPNSVLFYFNAIAAGSASGNGTFTASADL